MNAVSPLLLNTIQKLQSLPGLADAHLGGGTNLAIRFNHRKSIDIDMFFSGIVGKAGFEKVLTEVNQLFPRQIRHADYPCDINDQYIFLRFFISTENEWIKVEIIQNMCLLDAPDVQQGIRLITLRDIGLLKLMTATNRASNKDIYDLDYITDIINLKTLFTQLQQKESIYDQEIHKTIFSLDNELSPVSDPSLLLKFDLAGEVKSSRPAHSHKRIDIVEGSRTWQQAKARWRRKVRELIQELEA